MKTKLLVMYALFIALAVIGAQIKVAGSIAFDSLPGFLAALVLGPVAGAVIVFIGHMVSAALVGFPLSIPIHLLVAVIMALAAYMVGLTFRVLERPVRVGPDADDELKREAKSGRRLTAYIASTVVGYVINVILGLLAMLPFLGSGVMALFFPLTTVALMNLILADIIYGALPRDIQLYGEKL